MGRRMDRIAPQRDSPESDQTKGHIRHQYNKSAGPGANDSARRVEYGCSIDSPDTRAHCECHAADERETERNAVSQPCIKTPCLVQLD